ncbi:DUF3052 family protein [Sphingomonas sp. HT-1]|uniref:DUF3052 family protein n=1 Tax=unclassified Sphingomonas TaxID=196159 RepID=UPI0002FEBC3A|nr:MULTISPECIES: DUF3052 family protein [unclassified Sphingomonas]
MSERYPGSPLAARLGLKPGMRVWFHDMPPSIREAIAPDRSDVEELCCASDGLQAAYLFAPTAHHLDRELGALRPLIASNGFIWVSHPTGGGTQCGAEQLTSTAAMHGLVEQDRCAIGSDWTGVKLVPHNQATPA